MSVVTRMQGVYGQRVDKMAAIPSFVDQLQAWKIASCSLNGILKVFNPY